jgi:putative two-component system response regulator
MIHGDKKRRTLFIVDDNLTNLNIAKDILSQGYNVITIPSAKKMFEMLTKTIPDIILLDIEMPEMNGYEAIEILKKDGKYKDIPVIFITVRGDVESELTGLSLGAVDYISKPFAPQLLVKRVEIHATLQSQKETLRRYNENLTDLVNEKAKSAIELQDTIISAIAELVECRDYTTGGHIQRTQDFLRIFIDELKKSGLYEDELGDWCEAKEELLVQSSQFHDLGKIAITDCVLNKPDKLTDEEFEAVKNHADLGVKIIEKIQKRQKQSDGSGSEDFLTHAKVFAGSHHEKWDGTGYPNGLKGKDIPLQGRMMAIADVYDALISARPYKQAFLHEDAVKIIKAGAGTHFDPNLVEVFLERECRFKEAGVQ